MRKRLPSANLVHQVEALLTSRETVSCISASSRLKPVSSPLILIHFEKLAVQRGGLGGTQYAIHLGPEKEENGRRGAVLMFGLTIVVGCRLQLERSDFRSWKVELM